MLIEIGCGRETTRADLKDGAVRIGGGKGDEVRIAGLPPSLVTLRIEGERLTVTSTETLSIGRSMFPSHVPRLVIPGELVRLTASVTVKQVAAPRRKKGTATVMRDLMSGTCAIEQTQAPTLTVLTGPDAGNVIPLAFEQLLIGRGDDCALQIRDKSVSRRHARLTLRETKAIIEDLRGANGTYLNGHAVRRRATLSPGDVIELGQTVLRFDAPQLEGAKKASPEPPSVVVDRALVATLTATPKLRPFRWLPLACAGAAVAVVFGVAAVLSALA
ncbi:MAG: FHA domain-containing protein [Archangiaceae bacterium]|nr:FHA domain-containing protein [Archangiaceae bacterium]